MILPGAAVDDDNKRRAVQPPSCSHCSVQSKQDAQGRVRNVSSSGHASQPGAVPRADDDSRACRQRKLEATSTCSSCDSTRLRYTNDHVITIRLADGLRCARAGKLHLASPARAPGPEGLTLQASSNCGQATGMVWIRWMSTRATLFVGRERRFLMLRAFMFVD